MVARRTEVEAANDDDDDDDDDGGEGGSAGVCTADAATGKAWLDAARNGLAREMASLLGDEPSLLHYRGVGLGQTALHWASTKGHDLVVGWLLQHGAPTEARNIRATDDGMMYPID